MGPMIKTNILQYTRLYIEMVKAKILSSQRLWGSDSWFSYKVEAFVIDHVHLTAH